MNAYIVDAVRTPGGKNKGSLSKYHPADLGAIVVDSLVSRNKIDPNVIDDVIFGCVSQVIFVFFIDLHYLIYKIKFYFTVYKPVGWCSIRKSWSWRCFVFLCRKFFFFFFL